MSTELAAELYESGKIDFILCFTPSISVSNGFHKALTYRFKRRFDGRVGAIGGTYTYQSMAHLDDEFWEIFDHHKVLVIFECNLTSRIKVRSIRRSNHRVIIFISK